MAGDGSTRVTFCQELSGFTAADAIYRYPTSQAREWRQTLQPIIEVQGRSITEVDERDLERHRNAYAAALVLLRITPRA
jgi:hypothetical protein